MGEEKDEDIALTKKQKRNTDKKKVGFVSEKIRL